MNRRALCTPHLLAPVILGVVRGSACRIHASAEVLGVSHAVEVTVVPPSVVVRTLLAVVVAGRRSLEIQLY